MHSVNTTGASSSKRGLMHLKPFQNKKKKIDSPKLKDFADDNFKFEMAKSSPKGYKTL